MKKRITGRFLSILIALLLLFTAAVGIQDRTDAAGKKNNTSGQTQAAEENASKKTSVKKDGEYTGKEEVAEYIYLFGCLPDNFITKKEAKKLGWDSSKGNLWDVAPGKSIGGDIFGNREGLLPEKKNRKYYECDIDYQGGYRGPYRIIYSNDGLIYYTEDHYETFDLLYGKK